MLRILQKVREKVLLGKTDLLLFFIGIFFISIYKSSISLPKFGKFKIRSALTPKLLAPALFRVRGLDKGKKFRDNY